MAGQRSYADVLQLIISRALLLYITFEVSQTKAESHGILSCKTRGIFLSLNRTLAPLERVTSSNDAFGYPATRVYHFGYGEGEYIDTWCSTAESDPDPYIEMELTSPVLITQILFSGRTGTTGLFHATNLTLEYSPPDNETILNYYTTESGDIKYFAAPDLNTLVPLEQSILTDRIRLRPVEWFVGPASSVEYICLGVGLYGCLASDVEATSLGETSTTVERQSSSTGFQSVTTDNSNSETATQTVIRDYQALAIVLPIALLTIAINALLVGVSVYICVFLRRQKETGREKEKAHGYENLEWSSNSVELADSTVPSYVNTPSKGSGRKESVVKKVDNPIYGSSPVPQLETDLNQDAHIYTSASETGYEPIDHDIHTIHEAGVEGEGDSDEDMLDNLAYGKTGDGEKEETIGLHRPKAQHEAADTKLTGNESYNAISVPSTSVRDDEGEYAYPTFGVASQA